MTRHRPTQTLYSVRSHVTADGTSHDYFITKFVDGEVESAYALSASECTCPAGHRHTCRHRLMLPEMIAHGLVNTHFFWDFDHHRACDFNGMSKSLYDIVEEPMGEALLVAQAESANPTISPEPHSPTVTTPAFDAGDAGSSPAVVATTRNGWRRM